MCLSEDTARCMCAIDMVDGVADINRDKCLGCAVCVSKCPVDAITMQPRPKSEQVEPPKDFGTWEKERLENRKSL